VGIKVKAAFFSGLALAITVIAAQAAMDQSRDPEFEKEKIAYIRQYASPKRTTAGDSEILFSEKTSGKPAAQSSPDKPVVKAAPAEIPAQPPPESE
jgi:hypothetical protein